jgi:FKBP-type peptidyl-prolyl cis-trans isomerase
MKKLSRNEWIGVAAAVVFVGYTLFGGDIMSLFQKNSMNENASATAVNSESNTAPAGGVIIKDITVGNGPEVKTGQLISVNYVLSLADGTVIQESKVVNNGQPFQFTLGAGQVIPGWEMGFAGMKIGGVRVITIPPELAYGANQAGPIPANSTLVFTIELLAAKDVAAQPAQ